MIFACMETKRVGLTAVHIYIICFKAEVLSQMMAKWWWRLGGHGHLVEMSHFIVIQRLSLRGGCDNEMEIEIR